MGFFVRFWTVIDFNSNSLRIPWAKRGQKMDKKELKKSLTTPLIVLSATL